MFSTRCTSATNESVPTQRFGGDQDQPLPSQTQPSTQPSSSSRVPNPVHTRTTTTTTTTTTTATNHNASPFKSNEPEIRKLVQAFNQASNREMQRCVERGMSAEQAVTYIVGKLRSGFDQNSDQQLESTTGFNEPSQALVKFKCGSAQAERVLVLRGEIAKMRADGHSTQEIILELIRRVSPVQCTKRMRSYPSSSSPTDAPTSPENVIHAPPTQTLDEVTHEAKRRRVPSLAHEHGLAANGNSLLPQLQQQQHQQSPALNFDVQAPDATRSIPSSLHTSPSTTQTPTSATGSRTPTTTTTTAMPSIITVGQQQQQQHRVQTVPGRHPPSSARSHHHPHQHAVQQVQQFQQHQQQQQTNASRKRSFLAALDDELTWEFSRAKRHRTDNLNGSCDMLVDRDDGADDEAYSTYGNFGYTVTDNMFRSPSTGGSTSASTTTTTNSTGSAPSSAFGLYRSSVRENPFAQQQTAFTTTPPHSYSFGGTPLFGSPTHTSPTSFTTPTPASSTTTSLASTPASITTAFGTSLSLHPSATQHAFQ